ncbi:Helix-loop-helix DNA-binding domain protein [Trichuris suis]|uniref:BHLH domain-containing protein n=1 Tax=Trichuris suis TaxID=68888 RepID=A0A085MJV5_9BILA|nr:hypothetical protein M513_01604 [Trichuris suis]KHJ49154.1 Helix-loop-helix DNA-binding domain protein [Trichuris suis]
MSISDLLQAAAYLDQVEKASQSEQNQSFIVGLNSKVDERHQENGRIALATTTHRCLSSPVDRSPEEVENAGAVHQSPLVHGDETVVDSPSEDDDEFSSSIRRVKRRRHGGSRGDPNDSSSASAVGDSPSPVNNRASHNELEKNRRAHLRSCLEQVKMLVPLGPETTRHTTLSLLTKARSFIKTLEQQEKMLRFEKEQLDSRLLSLLQRVKALCNRSDIGGMVTTMANNRNNSSYLEERESRPQSLSSVSTISATEDAELAGADEPTTPSDLFKQKTGQDDAVSFSPYIREKQEQQQQRLEVGQQKAPPIKEDQQPYRHQQEEQQRPLCMPKPEGFLPAFPMFPLFSICPYMYPDMMLNSANSKHVLGKADVAFSHRVPVSIVPTPPAFNFCMHSAAPTAVPVSSNTTTYLHL